MIIGRTAIPNTSVATAAYWVVVAIGLIALALCGCEAIPLAGPVDYAAAERSLPPIPPVPPPDDGACWLEGPNCSGICTPCAED